MSEKLIDLTNKKFGRLLVLKKSDAPYKRHAKWVCLCDCGNEKDIRGIDLRSGNTNSCGCYFKERNRDCKLKHGQNSRKKVTSEYRAWAAFKNRCFNEKCESYKYYGGRGITVCDRWLNSFENFFADMGKKPSKWHSIDRINVNGNYEPDNCRWATKKEQANNVRDNKIITYKGESKSLSMWCDELGLQYGTIQHRLNKGYNAEIAFNTKVGELDFERNVTQSSINALLKSVERSKIPVLQYSLNNELIKEYSSISEAQSITTIKGIKNCVAGRAKTAGNFIWVKK